MNIKTLNKAKKALSIIEQLDKEIIEIEKLAMVVANNKVNIKLSLSLFNLDKEEKAKFDEDGSLVAKQDSKSILNTFYITLGPSSVSKDKPNPDLKYKTKPNDNTTLEVLGVLIKAKQDQRNGLIKGLQKLGFNI